MSRLAVLKGLHGFIQQRLTAALEDIFGHLEKTISKYDEQLLLDTVLSLQPDQEPQNAEVQQHLVIKEEVSPEHQWSSSPVQQDLEMPRVKEEKDLTPILFTYIPVLKNEESMDNREAELPAGRSNDSFNTVATAADDDDDGDDEEKEDCGGLETAWISESGSDSTASYPSAAETVNKAGDQTRAGTPQADVGGEAANKRFCCVRCGRRFGQKFDLQVHMRKHTGEKPFGCSLCGHRFTQKSNLTKHMAVHAAKTPCVCSVCGETFAQRGHLSQHMTVHMREKAARR